MNKKAVYFVIGFGCILSAILILNFFESKKEYASEYNFEIKTIEIRQNDAYIFYDNNRVKYIFTNYIFERRDSIEEGDKIIKKANSKLLCIYRKNKRNNKYELFLIKKPNGLFE